MNSPLYLSVVPADSPHFFERTGEHRRVSNWSDQSQVHRAVMSLFPDTDGTARSDLGVLYRVDRLPNRPSVVLVQSSVPPRPVAGLRTRDCTGVLEHVPVGTRLRFRTQVNAVRNNKGRRSPIRVGGPDGGPELLDWLSARLHGVADVTIDSAVIERFTTRGGGSSQRTTVFTVIVDGTVNVTDAQVLADQQRSGLGRARAFGCGLISYARA